MNDNLFLIAPVAMLLIGGGLLFTALSLFFRARRRVRRYLHAEGTIIGYLEAGTRRGRFQPEIEFTAFDGQAYRTRGAAARNRNREGATVTVLYRRSNPRDARIKSFRELYVAGIISATLGLGAVTWALSLAGMFLRGEFS